MCMQVDSGGRVRADAMSVTAKSCWILIMNAYERYRNPEGQACDVEKVPPNQINIYERGVGEDFSDNKRPAVPPLVAEDFWYIPVKKPAGDYFSLVGLDDPTTSLSSTCPLRQQSHAAPKRRHPSPCPFHIHIRSRPAQPRSGRGRSWTAIGGLETKRISRDPDTI